MKFLAFALAASVAFAGPSIAAVGPDDVVATLRTAGYAEVRELEFEDGLWEAEVRRANGLWGDVAVDPASGEVFDALSNRPLIELPSVLASLQAAGYTQVHDIDRDGALWDADAIDAQGRSVELRISGHDGRVLYVGLDTDD